MRRSRLGHEFPNACKALWSGVVNQALNDAAAIDPAKAEEREDARDWLRGCLDRDKVLVFIGLEPGWLDRLLPELERQWAAADEVGKARQDARSGTETASLAPAFETVSAG